MAMYAGANEMTVFHGDNHPLDVYGPFDWKTTGKQLIPDADLDKTVWSAFYKSGFLAKANVQYTASTKVKASGLYIRNFSDNVSIKTAYDSNYITFSVENDTLIKIQTYYSSGVPKIKENYLMLEKGSTPTPYEPFSNGVPAIVPTTVKYTGYKTPTLKGEDRVSWEAPYKANIKDVVVKGSGRQEKLTGKNLMPFPYGSKSLIVNGVTFTVNNDGTITVNGKATELTGFTVANFVPFSHPAGDYFLSGVPDGASNDTYLMACSIRDTQGQAIANDKDIGSGRFFKLYHDTSAVYLRIFVRKGAEVKNKVFKPQIEKGRVATSFEPYCGGIPAPNPQYPIEPVFGGECEVVSRGKNLAHKTLNGFVAGTVPNKWQVSDSAITILIPSKIVAGETLVVSSDSARNGWTWSYSETNSPKQNSICFIFADGVKTATIDKNPPYPYILIQLSYGHSVSWYQLEIGSTPTPYEPYFDGGTFAVPVLRGLPDGSVQDEWDATTGKLTRRIGEVSYNGTERMDATYYPTIVPLKYVATGAEFYPKMICSHLSNYFNFANVQKRLIQFSRVDEVWGCTTVEQFKTALKQQNDARTPVTIWYALETPIIEQYPVGTQPIVLRQHPGTTQLLSSGCKLPLPIEATVYMRDGDKIPEQNKPIEPEPEPEPEPDTPIENPSEPVESYPLGPDEQIEIVEK